MLPPQRSPHPSATFHRIRPHQLVSTSISNMKYAIVLVALCAAVAVLGQSPPSPPGPWYPPLPPTCPLHINTWVTRRSVKNQTIEALTNLDPTLPAAIWPVAVGAGVGLSLARVTLAPCGVRTMHTHINVDEMLYVLSGTVSVSTAWPNGTICEQSSVKEGEAYLYPRNLIHSARNPSCTNNAVVLGFFSAFDSATVNVAAGANNMPGSPFPAYTIPDRIIDVQNASDASTLAYDALCLTRCKFDVTGGQHPA